MFYMNKKTFEEPLTILLLFFQAKLQSSHYQQPKSCRTFLRRPSLLLTYACGKCSRTNSPLHLHALRVLEVCYHLQYITHFMIA